MKINDFLEKPPKGTGRNMRSTNDTTVEYNAKQKGSHHSGRSIIRRHQSLIDWITKYKIKPYEFLHLPKERRKKKIRQIINGMDTEDNKLRDSIWRNIYTL